MTFFYSLPLPIRLIDCTTLTEALHAVKNLSPKDYAANSNEPPNSSANPPFKISQFPNESQIKLRRIYLPSN